MDSKHNHKNLPFTFRELLWFSTPALLVGLTLRLFLVVNMPYGFVISDTHEFVDEKATSLLSVSNPFKASTRTFLPKLLYTAPVTLGQPLLPVVAAIQHLFGLGMVLAGGVLCALWTRRWRWWIIPWTLILAVHPTLLWYEHMALPDSSSVAFALMTSAFGALYYWRPCRAHLIGLSVSLVLLASARQEGFIFLPFGLLIVLLRHYGELKAHRSQLMVVGAVCLLAFLGSRTSQGGQLLLTSTIQMAPEKLWSKPEFSQAAVALRELFRPKWPVYPNEHNASRKIIVRKVHEHLGNDPGRTGSAEARINNKFCKSVALEIALRNFWRMPGIAYNKFLATRLEPPSPLFDGDWLHRKQLTVIFGKPGEKLPKDHSNMKIFYGREFASREEFSAWLEEAYPVQKLQWLARFQKWFVANTVDRAPPTRMIEGQPLPGLSYLYLLGFVGLLAAGIGGGELRNCRLLWIAMMVGQAFVVFCASSLRSRYRLLYEPWFYLGLFCLIDLAVLLIVNLFKIYFPPRAAAPRKESQ